MNDKIDNNDDIIMYDSKDIQKMFKCGTRQTYELLHTKGFPTITIGRKMIVEKRALEKWLTQNQGRKIIK